METFRTNSELECFDFADWTGFLKEADPEICGRTLFSLGKTSVVLTVFFCLVAARPDVSLITGPTSLLRAAKLSSYLNARLLDIHLQQYPGQNVLTKFSLKQLLSKDKH